MATGQARVNYWPDSKCARAFWGQHELPPYRRLLRDTIGQVDPRPGQRWLDLGCGCGQLTQALWQKSNGTLAEVVGLDVAAENAVAFERFKRTLTPPPGDRIRFVCADFSAGLAAWPEGTFNGVVSGLSIQYAESYSESLGRWTTEAYDRLLADVLRVLRPGGAFVFSVNVPEPAWGKVAVRSLAGVFAAPKPARYLGKSLRMMRYGGWLTREARLGRFHYLPADQITFKLGAAGFAGIGHSLSYAGQAYVFGCRRPA